MQKNIFKKFIFLFSLGFILFGYNIAFASDNVAPIISDFSIPSTSTSLEVPITSFIASDTTDDPDAVETTSNVTGYLLIESPDLPSSDSSDWSSTPQAIYTFLSPGIKTLYAWTKDAAGNISESANSTITITIPTRVNLTVRDRDVIFSRTINLPEEGIVGLVDIMGVSRNVNTRSILSILKNASDMTDSGFNISKLKYYEPFDPSTDPTGSLYLKCITDLQGEECDNWQYTIDDSYPYVGMDKEILTGDKYHYNVYIYFGPQNKFVLSSNKITTADTLTVTSQKYDYQNDNWVTRTGVIVGLTQPDVSYSGSPTEIKTSEVDLNGQITFSEIPEGTYNVGVKEDGYWPTEELVVTKFIPSSSGSGSGGTVNNNQKSFSTEDAISFLLSNENKDGSFGGDNIYTDWAAVAAAIGGNSNLRSNIYNYFKNNKLDSNLITDNERHAMALMAIGINPYSETDINYIKKIVDSFDGTQIGESSLVNDDIFGLIVLDKVGYNKDDEIIKKTIENVILKQFSDGSWGGVDMTAAAIMALRNFEGVEGVRNAISSAESYIIQSQNEDGGFNNSFSTSWAIQALSLNNSFDIEVNKAIEYLSKEQQIDGGVIGSDINSRIWATSYAIPAISKLSWSDILLSFEKVAEVTNDSNDDENKIIEGKKEEIPVLILEEKNELLVLEKGEESVLGKNIEKKGTINIEPKEEINNNLLTVSVAESNKNISESIFSFISKIFNGINVLINWLLVNLSF